MVWNDKITKIRLDKEIGHIRQDNHKEVENIVGNAYKVKITSVENVQKMRKILRKIYHYDRKT